MIFTPNLGRFSEIVSRNINLYRQNGTVPFHHQVSPLHSRLTNLQSGTPNALM